MGFLALPRSRVMPYEERESLFANDLRAGAQSIRTVDFSNFSGKQHRIKADLYSDTVSLLINVAQVN